CIAAVCDRGDAYPIPKYYNRRIHGGLCQEVSCNDERTSSLRQLAPEAIALKISLHRVCLRGSTQINMKPTFQPPSASDKSPLRQCTPPAGIGPPKVWPE